jgi:sugar phosphate isomerase/epimerase
MSKDTKMNYGVALDCLFRDNDDFKKGVNLEEILDCFKTINVNTVEINSYRRFEIDQNIYDRKLRLLGEQNDFEITLHNGNHNLSSLDEEKRENQIKAVIEQLEYNRRFLNPELIVLHPGDPVLDDNDRDKRYAVLRESSLKLLEYCSKYNIKIVYENMRDQYPTPENMQLIDILGRDEFERVFKEEPNRRFPRLGGRISELLKFVRSFNSDLIGLCIDTGHANISEGNRMNQLIEECGKTLWHVHTSDNFGRNDDHLPPGAATIDWEKFYQSLNNINYAGTVLLEIVSKFKKCSTTELLNIIKEDNKLFNANGSMNKH